MSIKEQVNNQVNKIVNIVSNEDEKREVLGCIEKIIGTFSDTLIRVTERQSELEDKVCEVFDMLSQIEEELLESFSEDFEAECPYCGEMVPLKFPEDDDNLDLECPKCHNIIELELMMDEHDGCGCKGCHDSCDCDDCDEE